MSRDHNPRKVTLPDPRCPMCERPMGFIQLKWFEKPDHSGYCWHEQWGCVSCHAQHTWPARVEFMVMVRDSQSILAGSRTFYQNI